MIYRIGEVSKSVDVLIVDDSGLPVTGLVAATFPTVKWSRAGANSDNTLTLNDLALITTSWISGGVKERGEGVYRIDLTNSIFAAEGKVRLRGEASGKHLICEVIEVSLQMSIIESDKDIDTTTTPWSVVYKIRNDGSPMSGTELFRKGLLDVNGDDLVSTNTVVGGEIQQ